MIIKRTVTNTSKKDPRLKVNKTMPATILLANCVCENCALYTAEDRRTEEGNIKRR